MPSPGTEAEKPQDKQDAVIISGRISETSTLRDILEVVTASPDVQHGVLRILSKDVRGHIGIFCGTSLTGAHVTSTREYGIQALEKLLSAQKGMFAFLSLPEQQIELRQSLTIPIDELLQWKPAGQADNTLPDLSEAILAFAPAQSEKISDAAELGDEQLADNMAPGESGTEKTAGNPSYMAWGGEVPVLASNLSRLTSNLGSPTGETSKVVIERIAMSFGEEDHINTDESAESPPPLPSEPPPLPAVPNQSQDAPQLDFSADVPEPKRPTGGWSVEDLEAIPTPKADGVVGGAANPGVLLSGTIAKPQVNPEQQVLDDINRAFSSAKNQTVNNKVSESVTKPAAPSAPALPNRPATKQDKDLNTLVTSQRTRAVDAKAFIAESSVGLGIEEERTVTPKVVIGGLLGVGMTLLLANTCFQIISHQSHFEAGLKALKKGQNEVAQVEFSTAIKSDSGASAPYFYRALAEARMGADNAALADYATTIGKDNKNVFALIARASLYNKKGDYDKAIEDCDTALKIKSDFLDALRVRSLAYGHKKQYKECLEDCNLYLLRSKGTDKREADALANRAYAYFKLGKMDEALDDYNAALALDHKNGQLFASRAVVFREMKAWPKALADCARALELIPGESSLFQLRAECRYAMHDIDRALYDWDKAVKMNPSVENHRMRGRMRLELRDFQGAMQDFDFVLASNANDHQAKKLYDAARQNLNKTVKRPLIVDDGAIKIKLASTPAEQSKQGYALLRAGQGEQAVIALTASVRGNPNDLNARRYLAHALIATNDLEGAIGQFESLVKMSSMSNQDRVAFAKVLHKAKHFEDAATLYTQLLGANPSSDDARIGLAEAYLEGGFAQKAKLVAQEGLAKSTSPSMIQRYEELIKKTAK